MILKYEHSTKIFKRFRTSTLFPATSQHIIKTPDRFLEGPGTPLHSTTFGFNTREFPQLHRILSPPRQHTLTQINCAERVYTCIHVNFSARRQWIGQQRSAGAETAVIPGPTPTTSRRGRGSKEIWLWVCLGARGDDSRCGSSKPDLLSAPRVNFIKGAWLVWARPNREGCVCAFIVKRRKSSWAQNIHKCWVFAW